MTTRATGPAHARGRRRVPKAQGAGAAFTIPISGALALALIAPLASATITSAAAAEESGVVAAAAGVVIPHLDDVRGNLTLPADGQDGVDAQLGVERTRCRRTPTASSRDPAPGAAPDSA